MKQRIIAAVIAALAMAAATGFAAMSETETVLGKGTGMDKTEALKDAYRDAIERAVGLYVDAEALVQNEELVKDQILTQSNAYIEKYDPLMEETAANGLVTVTIRATVRKSALAQKVNDTMRAQTVGVGGELRNAHAKIATTAKRNADGAALLKNALEGFDPLKASLDCTLASSTPAIQEKQVRVGRVARGPKNGSVAVWYLLKTGIGQQRFFEAVAPVKAVLEQISVTPPVPVTLRADVQDDVDVEEIVRKGQSRAAGDGRLEYNSVNQSVAIRLSDMPKARSAGRLYVLLVTGANKFGTVYSGTIYDLDEASSKVLRNWSNKRNRPKPTFEVSLLDGDGDILQSGSVGGGSGCFVYNCSPDMLSIVPWMARDSSSLNNATISSYSWANFSIPVDALPEVKSVKVEMKR